MEYISRAIAIAPNISDWHSNLGGALRSLGRGSEAANALKRSVELKPESAVAHYNYGNALAELRGLYGTGHGKHGKASGLNARHAKLAVGASSTLAIFLFETHKETNR